MDVLDDEGMDTPAVVPTETCDHCGPSVRAYLFVLVNGTELAYCGSCGTRYFDNLVKVGSVIVDMRHAIHS